MPTLPKIITSSAEKPSEMPHQSGQGMGYMENDKQIKKFLSMPSTLFLILFLMASASTFYFYRQNKELRQNPAKMNEEKVQQVVEKVGQLIVLPEGETPTLATITDPEPLRNQTFFAKGKVGDNVLIYTGARKAILYDPVAHKIIEVAVLNIGQE